RRSEAIARGVERLEAEIRTAMEEGRIPSITVALTDREGELWAGAYGESNRWAGTPASTETVYLIGSTFKAQSTIGLLQQMESGLFRLDDPVNPYLTGFQIREEPGFPVTFRQLLTHTSGLPAAYGGHDVWGETVPDPLPDYLRRSLQVEGPPMERVVYSNLAYTLVGYLVEHFSGIPYKQYIAERVWAPLGMSTTAFSPTPSMEERLSIPYAPNRRTGELAPAGRTKADVWPAGIVYGTVHDQASWVRFNLGDGAVEGGRLLQPETMELMHTLQFPRFSGGKMGGGWGYDRAGYGLTWWTSDRDGEAFFAHSGSVSGYTAFVAGNRSRGFGIAILTNGHRAHRHLVPVCNLALDLLAEELAESR
ncbi:MAG: beta-lactamase family protein, partial [Gemmatimonadetes bacterium]|nr:beta-lactamase family protein [Gemmatimonadota bacterium]